GAVDAARWELAAELTEDLRGVDARIRETRTRAAALRALKRQISDAIFGCLQEDARRAAAKSPGGQPGNHSATRAAVSHPDHRLLGQATAGPATHPTAPAAPFPAPASR